MAEVTLMGVDVDGSWKKGRRLGAMGERGICPGYGRHAGRHRRQAGLESEPDLRPGRGVHPADRQRARRRSGTGHVPGDRAGACRDASRQFVVHRRGGAFAGSGGCRTSRTEVRRLLLAPMSASEVAGVAQVDGCPGSRTSLQSGRGKARRSQIVLHGQGGDSAVIVRPSTRPARLGGIRPEAGRAVPSTSTSLLRRGRRPASAGGAGACLFSGASWEGGPPPAA